MKRSLVALAIALVWACTPPKEKGESVQAETESKDSTEEEAEYVPKVPEEELYPEPDPIPGIIKRSPLLKLPLDLEGNFPNALTIPTDTTERLPTYNEVANLVYGLLPDTSRFYGLVRYGAVGIGIAGSYGGVFLVTYDKQFRSIQSVDLWVSHDSRYATGDCNSSGERYRSVVNADLSYRSVFTAKVQCAGDEKESNVSESISGKINRDGTITVLEKAQP